MSAPLETKKLSSELAERYRQMIRSGRLRPGERLPTIRELARELSISAGSVNEAFHLLERDGLVYRRTRLGTFVGSAPQSQQAHFDIGILFRDIPAWSAADNYGLNVFQGIEQGLRAGEHRAILVTSPDKVWTILQMPRQFLRQPVHGFIVDERAPDSVIEELVASGRPTVLVNRFCAVTGAGSVRRDNSQAGSEAARQFLARGHRVVACAYRVDPNGREAADAFLRVMAEAGLAIPAERIGTYNDTGAKDQVKELVRRTLTTVPVPTAIYCTDDRLAHMVHDEIEKMGMRVPDQLSLAGCLDLDLARQMHPPLATFRFNPIEIGLAAAQEILACCTEPGRLPGHRTIPGAWVERESLAFRKV